MQPGGAPSPARDAIWHELRRAVLEMYGEERSAEATIRRAIEASATALWRVGEESLEPLDYEPLPIHD